MNTVRPRCDLYNNNNTVATKADKYMNMPTT